MQVGQVVQLKSGSPNLTIEWEIGVSQTPSGSPIDFNLSLKNSTGYDNGDNSCIWTNKKTIKKKVFPVEALNLIQTPLIPATNQIFSLGCVVKVNGEEQLMTVNWIVGINCRPVKIIDIDKTLISQGLQNGDVSCVWFDKKGNLHEGPFRSSILTKVFD